MNAEIKNQERSLAILRAFGVTSFQISSFFQFRSLILLFYSLVVAFVIFSTAKLYIADYLANTGLPVKVNLELSFQDLLTPIALSLFLTQLTTFAVVTIWSYRNKYVAEKLQGL